MLGASRNTTASTTTGAQKFVILQSRSQTPTSSVINSNAIQQQHHQQQQQHQQVQQQLLQQQSQVKITQSNVGPQKTHLQNSATKLVVVGMPNSSHCNTTNVAQVSHHFVLLFILKTPRKIKQIPRLFLSDT